MLKDGVLLFPGQSSYFTAQSTGTGVFDPFNTYKGASASASEGSYNTDTATDNPMSDMFGNASRNHRVTIADLAKTQVTYNNATYYIISVDMNEDNSRPGSYLSLDQLQLMVRPTAYIATSGATDAAKLSGLQSSSTLVWDLDRDGTTTAHDREIFFDTLNSSGSGRADAFMLIPKTLLDPYSSSYYFYLFAEQGKSTTVPNMNIDASFEEWDLIDNTIGGFTFTPPPPVPEASTVGGMALVAVAAAWQLRRQRAA